MDAFTLGVVSSLLATAITVVGGWLFPRGLASGRSCSCPGSRASESAVSFRTNGMLLGNWRPNYPALAGYAFSPGAETS